MLSQFCHHFSSVLGGPSPWRTPSFAVSPTHHKATKHTPASHTAEQLCEWKALSLSNSLWPHGLYSPWDSPGQNTGVGSCSLFQGIFQTQRWNPGLPHCRRIPHQLSYQGSPITPKKFNYTEQLHQRSSHAVKKVLGPTTDFPTWGSGKGTETPQGIWLWRPVGFDYRTPTGQETDSLRARTKPCAHQDPGGRSSDPTGYWARLGCERPRGSGLRPPTGKEHSPAHQQKIGLRIYWAWPRPSEQDPVFPSVSLSHQEASISLFFSSIRGQREWKPQSQKTNQSDHMDHSLVQLNETMSPAR